MMLGLAAFAGIAAVSEGFSVVSPAATLGSQTSAFPADAARVSPAYSVRRRPGAESTTKMMSQATVGAEAGTSTKEPVYDQKSWALVSLPCWCVFTCSNWRRNHAISDLFIPARSPESEHDALLAC